MPHFYRRDGKFSRLRLPGWIPLVLAGQEILGRSFRLVDPWFAGRAILEPSVGTSNSQVDDEIKFLIEGRVQIRVVNPRVSERSAVGVGQRKFSTSPKVLFERVVEDLQETGVYVGEEVFLTPLQTISVLASSICGVKSRLFLTGAPVPIILLVRTPVKSAGDNIVSAGRVCVIIASGLSDVDFAGSGPRPKCIIDRQQPDGGPQPISHWHCGYDLDTAILESCTFEGVDAARLDWRDDGAVGDVCGSIAIVVQF